VFKKVLVATRGTAALRIVRTCRELGIKSVVPYSEVDRYGLPVLLADEAVCIGPAPAADSYANVSRLLAAAEVTGCDALHPGWGFLASDPEFCDATINSGIAFVGPAPDTLRLLQDRLAVRQLLKSAGIAVVPGSDGPITGPQQAVAEVEKLGLPAVVKPVAGSLRCARLITREKDVEYQVRMCQAETRAQTGSEQVYLERHLPSARPVDVLMIDGQPVGEWEAGFYYRQREIIAFSPANISAKVRARIYRWARRVLAELGFNGSATVRFLIDEDESPYLFGVNCELSPLHPLAEIGTGIDIVAEQFRIAAGAGGPQGVPVFGGGSFAAVIYAEDPDADFEPSPGVVTDLILPAGPDIRVESHLYPGAVISADYDLQVAAVFSRGDGFETGRRRLLRALAELRVGNVKTNLELVLAALRHPGLGKPGGVKGPEQSSAQFFA
jgi:acetyl-CoA carboxylase biotin carboxylase subunit